MKNIIYIVNINEPAYSQYCIKSWQAWAKKNNSEVVVLTEPFSEIEPHWYKVFAYKLLESSDIEYDRVLVVDNDTVVHPDTPNFFEEVPEDKIGVVFDDVNYDWTIRSTDAYRKHVFTDYEHFDTFEYFNSGFLVLSKQHRDVYERVIEFVFKNYEQLNWVQSNYGVGRDQTPLNFMLRAFSSGLEYMSKRYNLQGLLSKEIVDPKMLSEMAYVYHYNAMPREHREVLMKQTYDYLYE
jgi:lipopolysaccharide biosynthesis glycosyltransferase